MSEPLASAGASQPDAIAVPASVGKEESSKSKSKSNELLLASDRQQQHDADTSYVLTGTPSRLKPRHFVYLCTALACLSSILLGYDIGIMSGAIVYMEHDLGLTQWRKEVIISSLNLFSILGALFGGHLSHLIGRKKTIAISAVIFFVGALLIAATRHYGVIVLGRVLLGIASGTGLMIAPLYTAELSPPNMRGKLVTFAEISINVGILFGYFIAWCFVGFNNDDLAWRIMISFGIVPAIILFLAMLVMPESPRWLIENGKENEAYTVLHSVYGSDKNQILSEMTEIKQTIQLEESGNDPTISTGNAEIVKVSNEDDVVIVHHIDKRCGGWMEVLWPQNEYIKRALIIGVGISFFQQASGNEAAVYYTPHIFAKAGVKDDRILLYTTFVGLAKVAFIFISTFYLDKVGRRPLLFASAAVMTVALFGLTLAFWIANEALSIAFQCMFSASFSIGWGPVTWVIVSEIFPLHIRSKAMAICTTVNRLLSGTVALTFLSLQDLLTPHGLWLMFAIISSLSIVFVYRSVPETKGKTLEEITKFLMRNYKDKPQHAHDEQQEHYQPNDNDHDIPMHELEK